MKKLEIGQVLGFLPMVQAGNGVAKVQNTKARSKVLYKAGLGSDIANGELLLPSDVLATGLTNFDGGNKLNAGRDVLVTGIRMRFDTTADITAKTALWAAAAPLQFLNGEIVISQDGTDGNLLDTSLSAFVKYNAAIPTEDEFTQVIPFMLRAQSPISIKIKTPSAVTAAHAWKIELDCIEFTDATKA